MDNGRRKVNGMRLIDADALKAVLRKHIDALRRNIQYGEAREAEMAFWCKAGLENALDGVHNAPTIDAEPVRRGEWIHKPDVYHAVYCSECDFELRIDNTRFCPNCGARMDGMSHKPQSVPKHRIHTRYDHPAGRFHEIEADEPEFLPEFYGWDANGG